MSIPYQKALGAEIIGRAAVFGAGSMGSGIAAQFANAGVAVDLFDLPGEPDRDASAKAGIARQHKIGGFSTPQAAKLVSPCNTDDDLGRLSEVDWIIEAVVEDLDTKQALYRKIDAHRRAGSILSSNTSTIPLAELVKGMPPSLARDMAITHFFNPPHAMPLMELVGDPATPVVGRVKQAARLALGKTVIGACDTPGFVANRIGCFWLAVSAMEAARLGISVEEADAVQAAFGVPRTGVFGLLDLVGIDLIPLVWGSLRSSLPKQDSLQRFDLAGWATVQKLIANGKLGRKSGAGFYIRTPDKRMLALDLSSGQHRPVEKVGLPGNGRDLAALLADSGRLGAYARSVLGEVLGYSADHAAEIAINPSDVDKAMQLGYSWREGPFALAERLGPQAIAELMRGMSRPVPPFLENAPRSTATPSLLTDARQIVSNVDASLKDMGDGVAVFEIHRKMNMIAPGVLDALEESIALAGHEYRALVIGNDSPRAFSAGADLDHFTGFIANNDLGGLERFIRRGQKAFLALKYLNVPVVAAVHGFALGGGCELSLHADAVIAHADARLGLPETNLGLLPAWGGCTQLLLRAQKHAHKKGPVALAQGPFELLIRAASAATAREAAEMGFLRPDDRLVMHRNDLLPNARALALGMAFSGYQPPANAQIMVSGPSGKLSLLSGARATVASGRATETDLFLAGQVADVLSGGAEADPLHPMDEAALMDLECKRLVELVGRESTQARIRYFLETGKPLRN